jgi:hypothetical protein
LGTKTSDKGRFKKQDSFNKCGDISLMELKKSSWMGTLLSQDGPLVADLRVPVRPHLPQHQGVGLQSEPSSPGSRFLHFYTVENVAYSYVARLLGHAGGPSDN